MPVTYSVSATTIHIFKRKHHRGLNPLDLFKNHVMKRISPAMVGSALVIAAALLFSWRRSASPDPVMYTRPVEVPVAMCGALAYDWSDTTQVTPRILPGLGNLHYPVSTTSLKAQEFFEQGLRLVYGFNHWEAIQAFREAGRLDPQCAMAYWGLALAYGPNLNDVNPKDRERIAFEAIQKAIAKKGTVSPVEKDMIDALAARYNGKAYDNRDSLNQAYASAMLTLAKKYPDDAEVQTLAVDAVMNTMPWDYWEPNGSPRARTTEAKTILEGVLKKFPNHPGAHHLYIHLVEASPKPEEALPSAKFLETAMPGAGHIVHMPAHIYIRTGDYARSIEANQKAVKVDEDYLSSSANRGAYRIGYYPHNIDFISYSSYMEGRSSLGIQTAMKLAYKGSLIAANNPVFGQYYGAEPMIAYVRFGKWNEILSLPDPDASLTYQHILWRFARGMALARTGYAAAARIEAAKLDSLSKLEALKTFQFSFNPVSQIVQVPLHLLKGEILIREGKLPEGVAEQQEAVRAEDALRYYEPPDWKIPARHFLGASLADAGKFADAEKVYLDDLKKNPDNGWSLTGLQLCQSKLDKKAAMVSTSKKFGKSWKNADVAITASRF